MRRMGFKFLWWAVWIAFSTVLFSSLAFAKKSVFMPPQASTYAPDADLFYWFVLVVSALSCVLVILGVVYLAVRYRRTESRQKSAYIPHGTLLEIIWTVIPLFIFVFMFAWGAKLYMDARTAPKDSVEIFVEGQKWSWLFQYKNGRQSTNELVVPLGQPIKLVMTSKDVIHSFFVPAFRVKQDVVPGRYSSIWFEATKEGEYYVFCAEFCGDGHSSMTAKVKVVPYEIYANWLRNDPYKGIKPVAIGAKVFKASCTACHQVNTQKRIGPGLGQLFGSQRKLTNGSTVIFDDDYVRESILKPNAKIVQGYPQGVMPTFAGQLSEKEIRGLIEYIKSLTKK